MSKKIKIPKNRDMFVAYLDAGVKGAPKLDNINVNAPRGLL